MESKKKEAKVIEKNVSYGYVYIMIILLAVILVLIGLSTPYWEVTLAIGVVIFVVALIWMRKLYTDIGKKGVNKKVEKN